VDDKVYLAVIENPALWDTTEPVLVIFLEEGSKPPNSLVDPDVIGLAPARGSWRLLLWDRASRRAFYTGHIDGDSAAAAD
jgi:hypothetical protein